MAIMLEAAHREGSMAVARNRIAEARKWLAEQKLDAVMAFNDGQNSFLDSNAGFVFTGVRALGESVVVIPRDGDVADMLHRLERIETSIETLAVEIERISEGQRFTTRLLAERAPSVPAASAALPGSDPLRQER